MNAIIIKSANSAARTIKRKDGTSVTFIEQTGAIETGEDFPRPFRFTLEEGQKPYQPGAYYLDSASLEVGDYDALKIGRRVKLLSLPKGP